MSGKVFRSGNSIVLHLGDFSAVFVTMKAVFLSRPGDFGLLEDLWDEHPLFLPILDKSLARHHGDFLKTHGIPSARLLWSGAPSQECQNLESQLKAENTGVEWSVRPWDGAPLPQTLNLQRLYTEGSDCLVLSVPNLFLEPLCGPRPLPGFPEATSKILAPRRLSADGSLKEAALGSYAPLTSPREYFLTVMKLLTTVIPRPASLKGVHPRAELVPPLFFQEGLHIGSGARIGPQCVLAPGSRIEAKARLERVVLLSPVRIGKDFELKDQIVHGNKLLSPYHNSIMEIPAPRLLKPVGRALHGVHHNLDALGLAP